MNRYRAAAATGGGARTEASWGRLSDLTRVIPELALSVVLLLTAVSFGPLFAVVIPGHHEINGHIFGIGLAITAYLCE